MVEGPQRRLMNVEDYLELDRTNIDTRYEYIDGVVTLLAGVQLITRASV